MAERIGLYVCECGPNIKEAIHMKDVLKYARGLEKVVLAKPFRLLCSKEGKELLEKDIREHELNRVVIAACSPKEHEITFRQVLGSAGLNPFLLQMANIREQCAWVIEDKRLATEKAKQMINAAVKRVTHHGPLETREIECQSDVLVVGAGIAGISAALTLAQKKRKVYVVEKLSCIGGKIARYEDLYPTLECASCILDPKIDEVLHNEQIELFTLSEVQEVLGYYGNFHVKVQQMARYVDSETCLGCGACFECCPVRVRNEYNEGLDERRAIHIPYAGALPNVAAIDRRHCLRWQGQDCHACQEACPFGSIHYKQPDQTHELEVGAIILATGFDLFDPGRAPQYGYGKMQDVYTSLEFERILSSTGPTGGKILLRNGQPPKRIALVHCVGSRTSRFNEHCSGICCMYALKFSHEALQKLPGVSLIHLYTDLCLPGKESQSFYNMVSKSEAVEFHRMRGPDSVEITEEGEGLSIKYTDVHGNAHALTSDMVVLAPAVEGARDAPFLARVFEVSHGKGGFYVEGDTQAAPVSTAREGVFIAGCAQGPKDIQSSVAQGQAAAGLILSSLIPGQKLELEPMAAEVREDLCASCKICTGLCPYKAIYCDDEERPATVNELLCKGCGICAAACPSGAIKARHFTDTQISEEIKGVVEDPGKASEKN
ncbi:MAG: CoB--CoM heterodisulfide reductase iron-sulfur subunit A family protein [Deltaproteobacteria bacterium]|nr:MAG: CoB--CoM heterodisulfide reductase iron-sulfur subunit A family protein [Deltaproteobacteria bacterium]